LILSYPEKQFFLKKFSNGWIVTHSVSEKMEKEGRKEGDFIKPGIYLH